MAVVLDTCAWLWHSAEPEKLSAAAAEAIARERERGGLVVSVISCWEIGKLVEKGRLELSVPVREWIRTALRGEGVVLHPLTPDLCADSVELPGVFHGDPADQIIVATARRASSAVVTKDRRIIDYPHVPTIW